MPYEKVFIVLAILVASCEKLIFIEKVANVILHMRLFGQDSFTRATTDITEF